MQNPSSTQPAKNKLKVAMVVLFLIACFMVCLFVQESRWHEPGNLPNEYEEVFATPLSDVKVTDYWNSSVGHGTRFSFMFQSTVPIRLGDSDAATRGNVFEPDCRKIS